MFQGLLQNSTLAHFFIKFLLELVLLLTLKSVSKNDSENISRWAFGGIFIILLRDLFLLFFPDPSYRIASDGLVSFCIVGMFFWKSHPKWVLSFGLLSLLFIILPWTLEGLGLLPPLSSRFFILPIPVSAIGLIILKGRPLLDKLFTDRLSRWSIPSALLIPPLWLLFFPTERALLEGLITPLSYLALIFAVLQYGQGGLNALIAERDELSNNLDILYNFVFHSSDSLRAGGDLNKLMGFIAQTLLEGTRADGAMILMVEDFEDVVKTYTVQGLFTPLEPVPDGIPRSVEGIQNWLRELKIPLGQGLFGEIAKKGAAVFIQNAQQDSRIVPHPSLPVGSLIAVPLKIEDRIIGVATVVRRKGVDPFINADFDRASLLADFSSLVVNNIYSFQDVTERSDIDTAATIAEDIQKTLLPKRIPKLSTLSLGAFSESARGVCSDYYDIIPIRRDRIFIILGDIAGKGIQAGLIMVMIRSILHLVTNTNRDTATILNWVNRGITGKIDLDHFATLQILMLDPTTGKCEYANAGHRSPLVWRQNVGLVQTVDLESVPIGVESSTEYRSISFTLEKNDILLLYTDGVVEALNDKGNPYGVRKLISTLQKSNELTAPAIVQLLQGDIKDFTKTVRQHDDRTVVVAKKL